MSQVLLSRDALLNQFITFIVMGNGLGSLYQHGMILIPAWRGNRIPSKVRVIWHFFIRSQASTVAPLKFGNGQVISSTLFNGFNYLPMLGFELILVGKGVPGADPMVQYCLGSIVFTIFIHIRWQFDFSLIEIVMNRSLQCLHLKRCHSMSTDLHWSDVIISAMASQITGVSIVYSTVCSGADQRKHQSPASLACVRGIHWWPHKGPVTRKMFPFDDVIMCTQRYHSQPEIGLHWTKIVIMFNNDVKGFRWICPRTK